MFKKFILVAILLSVAIGVYANPAKDPIKLTIGWAPGGPTDIIAQQVKQILQVELNRSVILEYRPGASTDIAVATIAKNKNKETNLMLVSTALSVNNIQKNSNYNYQDDITYVSYIGYSPLVIVTTPQSEIKSVADIKNWPSNKPLFIGTGGPGSGPQMCADAIKLALKKEVVSVPYKGGSLAIVDLVANRHSLGCHLNSLVNPFIQDGKLIPLMVTSPKRLSRFPTVPTAREEGIDKLEGIQVWNAIIANTTADPVVIKQVEEIMDRIVKDPRKSKEFAQAIDLELNPALTLGHGSALAKFVNQDITKHRSHSK